MSQPWLSHSSKILKILKNRFHTEINCAEKSFRLYDVVIAGVPSKDCKVHTNLLEPGVVAINSSSEKSYEKYAKSAASCLVKSWKGYGHHAATESFAAS